MEQKALKLVREKYFDYKTTRHSQEYHDYQIAMDFFLALFGYESKKQSDLEQKWDAMWRKEND